MVREEKHLCGGLGMGLISYGVDERGVA